MKNRALFDVKCPTCGSWMNSDIKKSEKGKDVVTHSCPECGLPTAPMDNLVILCHNEKGRRTEGRGSGG